MTSLPQIQELMPLDAICDVIMGQSPPSTSYNTEQVGLPFYQGKAEFGDLFPTPRKWCTEPKKIAEPGDVIISVRAPVGPTNLIREQSCIGRGLAALRPKPGVSTKYIMYVLRHTSHVLRSKATGTTFEAISGKTLREHLVPWIELGEQQLIVDEIETQFARLDDAESALRRVEVRTPILRMSLLEHFFGRGVDGLFPKIPIVEIAKVGTGTTPRKSNSEFYDEGEVPWITSGNLHDRIVTQAENFVTESALEKTSLKIYPSGTLLVAMYGEGKTRGTASILGIDATINQAVASIQLFPEFAYLSDFLLLFLESHYEELRRKASGGVQPNLNLGIIRAVEVPIPSESEAHHQVTTFDLVASNHLRNRPTITNSIQHLSRLRQAILRNAFEGNHGQ